MNTNRLFSILIVIGLVAVAALTVREAVATSLVTQQAKEKQAIQRGRDAEAARWAAQAEYYAKASQGIQRSRDAEAARLKAQAAYYANLAPPGSDQPGHLNLILLVGAARQTGEALLEFERSGDRKALPICITAETLAMLPETIGGNGWKTLVPVCDQ